MNSNPWKFREKYPPFFRSVDYWRTYRCTNVTKTMPLHVYIVFREIWYVRKWFARLAWEEIALHSASAQTRTMYFSTQGSHPNQIDSFQRIPRLNETFQNDPIGLDCGCRFISWLQTCIEPESSLKQNLGSHFWATFGSELWAVGESLGTELNAISS